MLELKKKWKKKMAGQLAEKKLPEKGCSRRNDKTEKGSRQNKISDDRQLRDKWTICRYEKDG